MSEAALLAGFEARRELWVPLPGGMRVQLRRPPETQLPTMLGGVELQHVADCACGWEGFTEAHFLGAGVGGSDAVPFSRTLWAAYVADNARVLQLCAAALAENVTQFLTTRADTAKN